MNRTLKVNLVETQKEKSYRESFNLLRENLSKPEQNVDRNINIHMRSQTEMRIVLWKLEEGPTSLQSGKELDWIVFMS